MFSKKNKIILLILLVFFLGLSVFFVYNYFQEKIKMEIALKEAIKKEIEEKEIQQKKKQDQENLRKSYNEHFPDFITGTLIIISEKEAKIKNEEGKEFLIDPARPITYYLESGVKNGSKVVLQGKIIDQEKVSMGNIKPLNN